MGEFEDDEVVSIGDEGGAGTVDEGSNQGDTNGDDNEDRGDDFTPTEDDEQPSGQDETEDTGSEGTDDAKVIEGDDSVQNEDAEESKGGIPPSRLSEVSRVKSAATKIADGLIDGTVDADIVRENGGAAAVAKAIANQEISLDDIKPGSERIERTSPVKQQGKSPESASWNLEDKYVELAELREAGELKEAAKLEMQLTQEMLRRDKVQDAQQSYQQQLNTYVEEVVKLHPQINVLGSHESDMVIGLTDKYTRDGLDRISAIKKAVGVVFPDSQKGNGNSNTGNGNQQEAPQKTQRQIQEERKAAAVKRGANATNQQPPPMGLGASADKSIGNIDITKMSDEEYEKLSPEQKAKARGDFLS